MVLRKCLLGGVGLLVLGTALYGKMPAAQADELTTADERQGVVRLSDQPRRGGMRLISQEEAAFCGQIAAPGGSNLHPGGQTYYFRDSGQDTSRWAMPSNGSCEACPSGYGGGHSCHSHGCLRCRPCGGWCQQQWALCCARGQQRHARLCAHFRGKLAYFTPMGNGGEGAPPFGCYHLVYPVIPDYPDPRDGQVYAAQGYGVPMSVPLAPTVRHTMNYSSGMPASRLTQISNVVPPRRAMSLGNPHP